MTELRVNDHTLLLLPDTEVQIEHLNPLFQDGIEDSFSLPVTVPVRGNEITLEHSQQLAIADRKTTFRPTQLLHNGVPLHNGELQVLGSDEDTIDTSFTVEGLVTVLKGKKLPDLLEGIIIDLLEEAAQLPDGQEESALATLAETGTVGVVLANRKRYRAGGDCHFPQHYNTKLYGESNPGWYKKGSTYEPGKAYASNDLVDFVEHTPLERTYTWQCVAQFPPSPTTPFSSPDHWRRVAYGVVNAWDPDTNYFQYNNVGQGNAFSLVPWFYVKWVMEKALGALGYTVLGDFMSDRTTDELLLPNSTTLDIAAPENKLYFFHVANYTTVYFDPATMAKDRFPLPSDIESPNPLQDTGGLWNPAFRTFECPTAGTWSFKADVKRNIRFGRGVQHIFSIYDESNNMRARHVKVAAHNRSDLWDHFHLTVALTAADVGHTFHFSVHEYDYLGSNADQYWDNGQWNFQILWPTTASDRYMAVDLTGSLLEERPELCTPTTTIIPSRHVPVVDVGEWLIALADLFNFTITPDSVAKTLRLDYREKTAKALDTYTRDETPRCVSPIHLDHQRAVTGYTLKFDIDDRVPDTTVYGFDTLRYFTEQDLPAPESMGKYALLRSTRQLLISRYATASFTFYWQHVGYYVPDITIGDGSKVINPAVRLLHMEQLHVKGHQYLMPVLEEQGTSAFFGDQGDRSRIYLCEYQPSDSADGDVTAVPSARSWGFGWNEEDRSKRSLVWYDQSTLLPGLYPQQWKYWLDLMVNAEPVHMDVQVDPPFLLSKAWQEPFLMRSQRFLIQQMPLEYPNFPGPLISMGVQALKVRRGTPPQFAISLQTEIPEPETGCSGEGYGSVTVAPGGTGSLDLSTTTGYYALRDVDGNVTVFPADTGPLPVQAGTFCLFSSDEGGRKDGDISFYFSPGGDITSFTVIGFTALQYLEVFYLHLLTALPEVPDSVITEYYIDLPLITSVPVPSSSANVISYQQLPLVPSLPSQPLSANDWGVNILDLLTTLPDFDPASILRLHLAHCPALAHIGVLPRISYLAIVSCPSLSGTIVDAFINRCVPEAIGGTFNIGSLMALRTSASDANYNACISAGWILVP